MKSFVVACAIAVVIAIGAAVILDVVQMPVSDAFMSQTGVRI